ncbi:MAG: toll/interleukin-1 receptor domain-containing protein [Xanthobacteraceae bacterium]|nr:toll/interleukin-1 receptor domain-containing protein [Xanthobacteraceae bacterium]
MAYIFISYKREDGGRVAQIVDGLRAEGLEVWWDRDIEPAQPWDETVATRLPDADCVVAVWSTLSVNAPWVKEEAGAGKQRGILVPALIHDVEPPLGFGLIQAADLRFWKGDRADEKWRAFVATVRKALRGEPIALLAMPVGTRRRSLPFAAALALVALLAAGALGVVFYRTSGITAAEQASWEAAVKARSRALYDAYLKAHPGGRFAPDARAALAACRAVEDVRHEPFEQKNSVTGVTRAGSFGSREDALLSARDQGRARGEERCAAIAQAEGLVDMRTRVEPTPGSPQCLPMGATGTTCSQQFWVTCAAQKAIKSEREVCG